MFSKSNVFKKSLHSEFISDFLVFISRKQCLLKKKSPSNELMFLNLLCTLGNLGGTLRAGEPEPEPERGAMEPANFGGAGAGAGAFLNISAEPEPEPEPQKFY